MNARRIKMIRSVVGLLGGALLGVLASGASAITITGALVAGSTCPGAANATYSPGGATQLVTMCVTTDTPICGGTYVLKSANVGEDGRFTVTARTLVGGVMTDPNTPAPAFPVSIVSTGTVDFGGTSPSATSQPAGNNLAVATFTIQPQATATNASYVLSLLNSGVTSTTSDCVSPAGFGDNPVAASFTFNKAVAALPTATIAITGATSVPDNGTALTYTVTLTPAPAVATQVGVQDAIVGTMTGVTDNCTGFVTVSTAGTGTCTVSANNVAVGDGPATATVSIVANGAVYNIGAPAQAVGTITNDDVVTISASVAPGTVAENSGTTMVYTFTAAAVSPTATSIAFTPPAANARYTLANCTSPVSLPANTLTVVGCRVTPVNNGALDGNVSVPVTILPSAGVYAIGTATATGTITDDEIGVSVAATTPATVEGGSLTFTISCTGTGTVNVAYSFSGSYAPLPAASNGNVTCGTALLVVVPTVDDAIINGDRSLTLTLGTIGAPGAVVAGAGAATGTVFDNDLPRIIPTMGTFGLLLLGMLLAAAAGFGIRRKA